MHLVNIMFVCTLFPNQPQRGYSRILHTNTISWIYTKEVTNIDWMYVGNKQIIS